MQTAIIVATFVVTTFAEPTPLCTSKPYYNNIQFVGANKKPESKVENVQSLRQYLNDNDYCLGNCILPHGPLRLASDQQKKTSCTAVGFRLSGGHQPEKYPNIPALTSCSWTGPTEKQTGASSWRRADKTKIRTHRGFRSKCRRIKTDELIGLIAGNVFSNMYECTGLQQRRYCFTPCHAQTPIACNHYDIVDIFTHTAVDPSRVRPCQLNNGYNDHRAIGFTQVCDRRVPTPHPTSSPTVTAPVVPVFGRTHSTHFAKNEYVNKYKVESDIDAFLEEENELQNERSYVFTSILGTSMVLSCCICGSLIFGLTCGMMAVEVMRRGFSSKAEEN